MMYVQYYLPQYVGRKATSFETVWISSTRLRLIPCWRTVE
jgi:hypothetical protein